ncbi:MAG: protein kinase [candidate division Zixibacteria bacterium]|nr:protein kinase [candidate division Zixibacteria bacterium]
MTQPDDDKTRTFVPLTNGTVVSHYRIVEKIGAGGMGEVYLAEDTKLNRKVALKFLPSHACQDADRRARFTREAQAAAKLDHPNIVAVHEVSEFNGRPFFSMQLVEGQSLREFLSGKTVPLDRVIELGIQICDGLQTAHTQGVTHRDIKPSNILIDTHGRPRIVDFGLASVVGADHLTKTGSTLGTVGYMSPEQVRGDKLDHRTDLFSFGVVLYEMITGHSPFKADSEAATLHAITDSTPELLARFRRESPAELQTIIDKALDKNVATRYQHADEMSADLKRLIATLAPAPIPARWKRRIVVPAIVGLVAIAAVVVFKPWQLVMTPEKPGATGGIRRVVVVPFKNETGDPSLDPIGKMVGSRTAQGIMLIEKIEVIRPEASLVVDTIRSIRAIARATGANRVVTGVYYKSGDTIQFQGEVNDSTETLLASVKPIYVPVSKVLDGVEEVRQRVMGAFEIGGIVYRAPLYEAVLEYKQGRKSFAEDLDYAAAITHFRRAAAIDTGMNSPWLNLFYAYGNLGRNAEAESVLTILDGRRASLNSAQKLDLDRMKAQMAGDRMGELELYRPQDKQRPLEANWYMVGTCALNVNRPHEAVEAFKKLDREGAWEPYWIYFAQAYHLLGEHKEEFATIREGRRRFPAGVEMYNAELTALAALGKMGELRELIERRPALPGDVSLTAPATPAGSMRTAAIELRAHGHEDEAMKLLEEAVRWFEAQPPETIIKEMKEGYAYALYCSRRWDKARVVYEELAREFPRDSAKGRDYVARLGFIAARQGDRARATEVSEWLRKLKVPYLYGEPAYARACIAAILGDKEQAITLLKESFLQGKAFSTDIHSDLNFESLWGYPPFIEFLKPKG